MAARSARSPKSRRQADRYEDEIGGMADFLGRNRSVIGGLTAFVVAFSYVGANALWYQPHAHGSAFFQTRPLALDGTGSVPSSMQDLEAGEVETIIRLERAHAAVPQQRPVNLTSVETGMTMPVTTPSTAPNPAVQGDPVVKEVQRVLSGLNLYSGDVDGLTGPQTRAAIEAYRKLVGLSVSAEIDEQLLQQLGAAPRLANAQMPQGAPGMDLMETSSAGVQQDAVVMRIQAGLRAFGNEGIEIDGVVGSRTRAAIREFQALFGLPETGEPDQTVYAKMREIGLTN